MKKIFNILFAAAIGLILLFSCDTKQKGPEYVPGNENGQYSFAAQGTKLNPFEKTEPQTVTIYRSSSVGTATVKISNIQIDLNSGKDVAVLDIPDHVDFADGKTMADISIKANDKLTETYLYYIILSIAEEDCSPGGVQELSFTATKAFEWESLGTAQYFDQLVYMVDVTPEGLGIQEIEIYKALDPKNLGYHYWKIVDMFKNTQGILDAGWLLNPDSSDEWIFYLDEDGKHVKYDDIIYTGAKYPDPPGPVAYQLPSNYDPANKYMDDDIVYIESIQVFQLNPFAFVPDVGSFPQPLVLVGMPGVDLASIILNS